MAQVKVTLVKSTIGSTESVKGTIAALGLKKIRSFKIHENTPAFQGQIKKVAHLVKVEEVEGVSMRIDTIQPAIGSNTPAKRLGRGIGSGLGKTSGKGHKGQWARSGGGVRPGFEGGQTPIHRRLPKRGFNNRFKKEYVIINLGALASVEAGTVVDYEYVMANKLAKQVKDNCGLKVLGSGELGAAITVKAAKFSASAKEAIEKAGGKAETL